jgi:glycosyltransferase involved in cell wall biosynthesis
MAAGVPVYAFAAMGTCDIIEPRRGALPAPQDAAEFAAGLADLMDDAPLLASLSQEGRHFAAEWSAPQRAQQLADLYRSLRRNPKPQP